MENVISLNREYMPEKMLRAKDMSEIFINTSQTTLNVYGHVMPNVNKDAMNLLKKIQYEQNMSNVKNGTSKIQ